MTARKTGFRARPTRPISSRRTPTAATGSSSTPFTPPGWTSISQGSSRTWRTSSPAGSAPARSSSRERAILVRVETNPRNRENSLGELKELAASCGVEVFDAVIQHRPEIDPKYLIGKGKLSDLVIRALQIGANLLIFDHELTPAQIRSITDFTELKVIDRTQVILDIFAQRAHSRDGKIQVELAQLKYLLPRLIEKDTAMSRLTGGIGGTGPGETKLEIDRRRVRDRIHHLEEGMKNIQKGRNTRRSSRERAGLPVISIVGYTNAGKSTLLNALTNSDVLVEDRLFATLDPKSSRLRFPRDTEAVITDTVGFIRDLPKELFAAFRATLDELHEADVLLHVIDVSNPDFEAHIAAVEKILEDLGIAGKADHPRLQQGGPDRRQGAPRRPVPAVRRHRRLGPEPVNVPGPPGQAGVADPREGSSSRACRDRRNRNRRRRRGNPGCLTRDRPSLPPKNLDAREQTLL